MLFLIVRSYIELFEQIDADGNGRLDWEEITDYLVEAGMAACRVEFQPITYTYIRVSTLKNSFLSNQIFDVFSQDSNFSGIRTRENTSNI